MEPLALSVGIALALVVLLRRPGVWAPALVDGGRPGEPDDDEEQLPETDRSPPSVPGVHLVHRRLGWVVAAVAAVRLVLLLTLHA
jgi:hypothetical protein